MDFFIINVYSLKDLHFIPTRSNTSWYTTDVDQKIATFSCAPMMQGRRQSRLFAIMLANKVMSIQRWFITYIFGYLAYQTTLQRASWIFPFQCTIPNSVSHQAIAQVTYHVFRNVWLWYLTQLLLYILKYTTQTYSILECQGSTMSYALMNTRK